MQVLRGPYKGRELIVSRQQPFVLGNDLRRVTVSNPYTEPTTLYVLRLEIKAWTRKETDNADAMSDVR